MANLERFGVVEFDSDHNVLTIEGKPAQPKSRFAILWSRKILRDIRVIDKPTLVLVTGGNRFTGRDLLHELRKFGFRCHSLKSNLLDPAQLSVEVTGVSPDYVIHLGAIS